MEDKLLDQWLEETTIQRLISEMLDKVEQKTSPENQVKMTGKICKHDNR